MPDSEPEFGDWSSLHGDASPTGIVGAWLRFVYLVAGPLVRLRVSPNAVTLVGLVVGASALWPAGAGSRWPLLAAALIGVSALLDGLDGAVAVLAGKVTELGGRLDHVCDRTTEVCFAVCLWLAGGLLPWSLAGALLALIHEGVRSWARSRGVTSIGVVTVSERPTRVLVSAMFVLAAGVYPEAAADWATMGGIVLTGAGLLGLGQLILAMRRAFSE